jgi:hypothetical protein
LIGPIGFAIMGGFLVFCVIVLIVHDAALGSKVRRRKGATSVFKSIRDDL